MKIKTMPVEKQDVQKLSGDELALLRKFGHSKEFKVFEKLAEETKVRRAFDALGVDKIEDLAVLNGINIGVDFILDAVERAKEELKTRGDDQDLDIKGDSK